MILVLTNENIQLIIAVKITGEIKVGGIDSQFPQTGHRIPPGTVLPRHHPLSGINRTKESYHLQLIKNNKNIRLSRIIHCLKDCRITSILCVEIVNLNYDFDSKNVDSKFCKPQYILEIFHYNIPSKAMLICYRYLRQTLY